MTFPGLLLRNLFYHWRGNLAVFLGIALGSAVLTGALLVGDSLRGSLKELTLDQLGWVEEAIIPGRFFRAQLAAELSAGQKAPALLMQGSATHKGAGSKSERVGGVTIFGIDSAFWPKGAVPLDSAFWSSEAREVVLSRTLARELDAKIGDTVTLQLPKADTGPHEVLLAKRKAEDITENVLVTVRLILPDEGMARFSLKPTPQPARNAFVPIQMVQKRLDLGGRANAVFIADAKPGLQSSLHKLLTLDDWGLRYRSPAARANSLLRFLDPREDGKLKRFRWEGRVPTELEKAAEANKGVLTREAVIQYYEEKRPYYSLQSTHMVLDPLVVRAVDAIESRGEPWNITELSVYLADTLGDGKASVPYCIVAGIDNYPKTATGGVLSPADFLRRSNPPVPPLADNQIVLMDWPGLILPVKPVEPEAEKKDATAPARDTVILKFYVPDEKNHLVLRDAPFKVRALVPLAEKFDDPDFAPEFPGITDKLDIASWENPPFPFESRRVKKRDEDFWKRYRTTPRAYVSLAEAEKLWGSRFGNVTTILITKRLEAATSLSEKLLAELKPEQGGFVVQEVRRHALEASSGTTPFGVLFLSFSTFLIASSLLLVGLLVRLNLDRRAGEMGLLLATGWDYRRVRRLLLGEGIVLAVVGSGAGLVGATIYGSLMIELLAANWPGGDSLNFLRLHTDPASFAYGYAGALAVSVLTLVWAARVLEKLSPLSLLTGATAQASVSFDARLGWSRWFLPAGLAGALALAIGARFLPSQEAQAGSFFASGALLLTACLAAVWNGLKWFRRTSSAQPTLTRLGIRNASRHAVRSILTVGLLAAASFVIVAVESFHKDTDRDFLQRTGGSGGFAFYAEGSRPVFEDLNQATTRFEHGLDTPEMRQMVLYPCRVQPGDDASCLNLYKPLKPRVMGISDAIIKRGGFHFASANSHNDEEKKNPWLLLQEKGTDDAIPAIVDANTAQWILNVKLGGIISVDNDKAEPVKLRIVALLEESIFQSEVLISETNFLRIYPRQEGFSFWLIDVADTKPAVLRTLETQLGKGLAEVGLEVQTTGSRLQGYLAVENTYLSTFQALGGLGLILGAVGLAIVLLRGVWERRAELALLQALGFRSWQLAWLVLAENILLLVLGLAAGTASALLAVAPHLVGVGGHVLWLRIAELLVLVLAVGLLAAALAVWSTLRTPVLTALRRE